MKAAETSQTLVFTVAMNGYQWLYRSFIRSHKRYAHRHGYRHLEITSPSCTPLGVECCWLKLAIIIEALKRGYQDVLFVDADAYIADDAPPIQGATKNGKALYMAKGHSGYFNSGVIYAKADNSVVDWLEHVIATKECKVSDDIVGWGENGHIIYHARNCDFIGTLNRRWNNTYQPELKDFIRHYNHGPLRVNTWLRLTHKFINRVTRIIARVQYNDSTSPLSTLTTRVIKHYSDCLTPLNLQI